MQVDAISSSVRTYDLPDPTQPHLKVFERSRHRVARRTPERIFDEKERGQRFGHVWTVRASGHGCFRLPGAREDGDGPCRFREKRQLVAPPLSLLPEAVA